MRQQDSDKGHLPVRWGLLFLLAALALGCSEQNDPLFSANDPAAEGETAEPDTTSDSDVGDDSTAPSAEQTGGTTTTTPSENAVDAVSDDEPQEQPVNQVSAEDTPPEGATSWAVVVAGASDPYDTLLQDAVTELGAAGFTAQITNCDVGAAQALQMSPTGTFTVSVYYESETAATQGVTDLAASGITGVATRIETSCPE